MPTFLHAHSDTFPDISTADADGLVAIGRDFGITRLVEAYAQGIFPWFEDDAGFIYWYCLSPRCVLYTSELHVSASMHKLIKQQKFTFKFQENFNEIILNCSNVRRRVDNKWTNETWISPRFIKTYSELFASGYAFCGGTYYNGQLVGGIYGVRIGNKVFGESMFSLMTNASKFALIHTVQALAKEGVTFLDCQQESEHLKSMGARLITLQEFQLLLRN